MAECPHVKLPKDARAWAIIVVGIVVAPLTSYFLPLTTGEGSVLEKVVANIWMLGTLFFVFAVALILFRPSTCDDLRDTLRCNRD